MIHLARSAYSMGIIIPLPPLKLAMIDSLPEEPSMLKSENIIIEPGNMMVIMEGLLRGILSGILPAT